jgi:hypothetical protein
VGNIGMSEIIIRIKEEYASLAPDISTHEYESLKQSLKENTVENAYCYL